jgi:SNF family Na+-dependent transporter
MLMPPGLRKFALATHLSVSVGWIGAVAGYLVLDVTVALSQDPPTVRAAWIGMDLIVARAILPLALAALVTGLIMSLGTKWGLIRHWWVLISFLLTVVATLVLVSETRVIAAMTAIAVDPATTPDQLLALPPTLPHSIGGLLVLLVVQVLNIYKPQGLTRYGWRKQQQERERRERASASIETRGPAN